eukprot:Clim_evm57s25 gene=Clim_evmTU57s25
MEKAVVIGATGAIGKYVVAELLAEPSVKKIVTLGRRKFENPPEDFDGADLDYGKEEASGRLEQIIGVDFENLAEHKDTIDGASAAFNCMGTTRKDAGGADQFRKIDQEWPMNFMRLAKECEVPLLAMVSAFNANKNSWLLYPKTKGETEEMVKALGFSRLHIWQPGLLDRGKEARGVEKIGLMMPSFILPSIRVQDVARGMVKRALKPASGDEEDIIRGHDHMRKLAAGEA